jgi:hypothetical protein
MISVLKSPTARGFFILVLLVSLALRVLIAVRGGQFYWPDESRYGLAREAVAALAKNDRAEATRILLGTSDHILFRLLGVVPASIERLVFSEQPTPNAFAAIFFGLFSVGSLALIWAIVRRITCSEVSATWSVALYAGCVTALFYTRHFFPYDVSLFFVLLAAWCGSQGGKPARAWLTGFWVGIAYLIYNTYWNVGAVILVVYTLANPRSVLEVARRGFFAGLGLATPLAIIFVAARLAGFDLVKHAVEFSHTVTQGDFGRGGVFVLNYFCEAEGFYAALVVGLACGWIWVAAKTRRISPGAVWALAGAALAAELVFFSDVVPRFAIAGRMAKPILLFFAVSAGIFAAETFRGSRRWLGGAVAVLLFVLGAQNFLPVVQQEFPETFQCYAKQRIKAELKADPTAPLQVVNAHFFHRPEFLPPLPGHDVLLHARHPLQFRPYVYEGYTEPMRDAFAAGDMTMRLVRFTARDEWSWTPLPVEKALYPHTGIIEMRLKLPAHWPNGAAEPLVVTGETGKGDFFSIRYLEPGFVRIEHDNWGTGLSVSERIEVGSDPGAVHEIVVCLGHLLPAANHPLSGELPWLAQLRDKAVIEWDGQIVLNQRVAFHPAPRQNVAVGRNFIGGSSTAPAFTGTIIGAQRLHPAMAARAEWGVPAVSRSPAGPQFERGAVEITFEWPGTTTSAEDQPILIAQRGVQVLELLLRSAGNGRSTVQLLFNHAWQGETQPIDFAPGPHTLSVVAPIFAAPAQNAPKDHLRAAEWMNRFVAVRLDGRKVIEKDLLSALVALGNQPSSLFDRLVFAAGSDWPLTGVEKKRLEAPIKHLAFVPVESRTNHAWIFNCSEHGQPAFDGAFGPVKLRLRLPNVPPGTAEPLLVSGQSGAGDLVYVVQEGGNRIRFGHDHWGWSPIVSDSFEVDLSKSHDVTISIGSLYPPVDSAFSASGTAFRQRRGRLYVEIDGRVVLAQDREFFESASAETAIGLNVIGGSSCGASFTGEVVDVYRLRPDELPAAARLSTP